MTGVWPRALVRQIGALYRYLPNTVMPYHNGMMNRDEKSEYNRLYRIANKARIEARRAERKADPARRCRVPGCNSAYDAQGYCARHYMAWRRNGDPTAVRQQQIHGKTLEERFALRVKKGRGCWEWTGTRNPQGYGVLRVGEGNKLAHRLAWELANSPIPLGLHACHKCDNRGCVRPDHLFLGTIADNNADMRAKGRSSGKPSKISKKDIHRIEASSATSNALAQRFGVSETTIRVIRRYGQTWRPR